MQIVEITQDQVQSYRENPLFCAVEKYARLVPLDHEIGLLFDRQPQNVKLISGAILVSFEGCEIDKRIILKS